VCRWVPVPPCKRHASAHEAWHPVEHAGTFESIIIVLYRRLCQHRFALEEGVVESACCCILSGSILSVDYAVRRRRSQVHRIVKHDLSLPRGRSNDCIINSLLSCTLLEVAETREDLNMLRMIIASCFVFGLKCPQIRAGDELLQKLAVPHDFLLLRGLQRKGIESHLRVASSCQPRHPHDARTQCSAAHASIHGTVAHFAHSLARSLTLSLAHERMDECTHVRARTHGHTHTHTHTLEATPTRASVRPLSPIWMLSGPKFASVRARGRSCRVEPGVKDTIPCTIPCPLVRKNALSNNRPSPHHTHTHTQTQTHTSPPPADACTNSLSLA